jgi:isoleucyl-tRNA synthetase
MSEGINEENILEFWKNNEIYRKSKEKNLEGKKFYMMDGPPYANGKIHIGHALNKTLKDIAMRSQRMQGKNVFDRPGYDTHGVPIELKVEKEIGSKGKQDIEKYGVKKFVGKCKEFATKHIDVMNSEFKNLGVWMDWDNPYVTLDNRYIEAVWHTFKEAHKKKLLYLGKYPVHVCPRCETAVAFNEIVYEKQKDKSVYVKFPLKNKKNTFLIIWTTTPWTLPANTGVMVNPNFKYQEVEVSEGVKWIIAKDLVPKIMSVLERGFTVKSEFLGKEMKGWEYTSPLAKHIKVKVKNGYKVVLSSRYVTIEDGTGLVHCAPGHGKEDYEVGMENGLDAICPVSTNGILNEETGKYKGKKAREVDKEIIEDLEKDNFLVYKMDYEHDYPLCWRDNNPLLMLSQPQWFFKISSIKEKMLSENKNVNWIPKYMELRMKAWLDGISDWPISRQRYWGTPLPIWINEKDKEDYFVVGSIEELEKLSGKKVKDLHKPEIDDVVIKKDGEVYRRVSEVLDVWFDSGVTSWAAVGFPQDKKLFEKIWPADLNIEGKDQFRGWWNSQLILSEIAFGKKPYENVIVHGMVLDLGKKKMSKSLGNVVNPEEIIKKFGRDATRYYLAKTSKGEDFAFNEKEFQDIGKIMMMFGNTNRFVSQLEKNNKLKIEDKWILSAYNSYLKNVIDKYNNFKFPESIQEFESFLNVVSRRYIQLIRERDDEVYDTLNEIRLGLIKTFSPICPFTTESMWQELRNNKVVKDESVHLSDFPKVDKKKIDEELEKEFENLFLIIEKGMFERDKAKIGLRWPIAKMKIKCSQDIRKELIEIIERQMNVKEVVISKGKELEVSIDTKMSEELETEGFAREISRKVQAERKNRGYNKNDLIDLKVYTEKNMVERMKKYLELIKDRTNSLDVKIQELTEYEKEEYLEIKGKRFGIDF